MATKCNICGAKLVFDECKWCIICVNGHKQK